MIKKLFLLTMLPGVMIACNQAKREAFTARRIAGYNATNYLWENRELEAQSLTMYELWEEFTRAFATFFDIKNNEESYDTHIVRLKSFMNLISERLDHKTSLRQEYEYDFMLYQEAFSEVMTFDEWYEKMVEQVKNVRAFLNTISRTSSKIKIGYAFRKFIKKVPDGCINYIKTRSNVSLSSWEIWSILKHRLNLD